MPSTQRDEFFRLMDDLLYTIQDAATEDVWEVANDSDSDMLIRIAALKLLVLRGEVLEEDELKRRRAIIAHYKVN